MEFADGGSMDMSKLNKLWSGPFLFKYLKRAAFARGIIDGITYLHGKNVVHTDLKPCNILCFGTEPVAKISDFGLAKVGYLRYVDKK
jgi:serine/threonine protein kinase